MPLPAHTPLTLGLYVHSLVATVLKSSYGGATLTFHTYALAFAYFHPTASGIVGIAHGLWFAWLFNTDGKSHAPVVATAITAVATLVVVLAAQFVARAGERVVPAELAVGAASVVAILAMAYVAQNSPHDFGHLYVRSAVYYVVVWVFESASRQTSVLSLRALQMMSLVLCFTVLALPVPVAVVVGLAIAALILSRPNLAPTAPPPPIPR